jgi:sugar lactone lactonase YvrE
VAKAWVALLLMLLTFSMCAPAAKAGGTQPPPIVVTGPTTLIGDIQFNGATGGWISGQSPLAGTIAVGPNGDVIYGDGYGGCAACGVFLSTPSGTQSLLASFGNSNAAGADQYGNVYIARDYGASFIKLPYIAATGTYVGFTTLPTANCLGGTQDTAACVFAPGTQAAINAGATAGGGNPGFTSLFFDTKGNFFFATDTNPGTNGNKNTIYECSAQCQAETDGNGTYPPVLIYADTKDLGAVSVDPWGNLFFADGADNGADTGKVSYLEELPLTGSTYASSPTVMTAYTTSSAYNALCGVAAGNYGTVYFSTADDGVFALPNTASGPAPAAIYQVSNQGGGKGLGVDSKGDLYTVGYSNALGHDGVFLTPANSLELGPTTIGGAATTAMATVVDSAANCTTAPTLTFAGVEAGVTKTEFTATAGSCSTVVGTGNGTFSPAFASAGAEFSTTVTFNPTTVGVRTATLTVMDSTNDASGTAALSGVGQGVLANLDPGVWTSYTTGFTSPQSISVDAAGNVAVADTGANAVFSIPTGVTTPVGIGTGFNAPEATAFDAAGNLYIADSGNNQIVWIPNVAGSLVPASQATFISSSLTFDGIALNKPTGLAVGPDGVLYIADFGNSRVVAYDAGMASVLATGLTDPWGIAVDPSNNVYVANTGGGNVLEFLGGAGGQATIAVTGVTRPWGVAFDASGSLLVSDKVTGNIVRVPNEVGTLNPADAFIAETNPKSAYGIALDAAGDLYTSDATGKAVYAIQRTAAAVNFGTIVDGNSSAPMTVYVANAGNEATTLATPAITVPSNALFTLTTGSANQCSDGSNGAAGAACQLAAVFSPITGTPAGAISTSGSINFSSPSSSATINLSGYAATSSLTPQIIAGFAPAAAMKVGEQATLSATGGASGNPVLFSIDSASACSSCATVNGNTLIAVAAGSVTVDANQAGNTSYAAAAPVKVVITISNPTATGVPALLMSQASYIYSLPSGGFTDGQNPEGGSFAVTQDGQIVLGNAYGNTVFFVNALTGTVNQEVTVNGPGGIAIDSKNNLYIAHLYGSIVYKVPFVSGAYVTWSDNPSPAPPACTGSDVAECTFATSGQNTKAIAFDSSGNFFLVSEPSSSGSGASGIYECASSCLPAGNATEIYADPNGVSQIALDPWGNLFFTDANYDVAGANDSGNSGSSSTNLEELVYTAGTGFAAAPTVLQTFTNVSPGNYDDMLASVAVNAGGTIYYGLLYDGTYAIPNTQGGGPAVSSQYAVSTQGAKAFTADSNGNLYFVANNGADSAGVLLINDLNAGNAQLNGPAVTATAKVVDNAFGCGTAATLLFTSTNPEFSATAGATCGSVAVGSGNGTLLNAIPSASSYTATISFTATKPLTQTATLNVSDTANGGTGTATVTGVGQETPQTITFTAPATTTDTYSPTLTVTLGATGGASNNTVVFTVDSASTGAGAISGNMLTVTGAGSIIIDANQAGGLVSGVYYAAATQAQLTLTVSQAAQAISFTAPASPVVYSSGLAISLSATGGASGNPVTFTVDASSTGAGTVSGATLTVTTAGTIVIDANQAATANYSAAAQMQQTVVVTQAAQAIILTPPTPPIYFIVGGIKINLAATGGGSGNPVVFTLDKASTGAGMIAGNVLTVTAMGSLVIDANQAGNASYTAAPQAQETINILSPLPTQTVTFANPGTQVVGTPLTLKATASSGFAVSFASTTAAVCTVAQSGSTWTASFVASGACTITASQPGDNASYAAAPPVSQSFTVNATGVLPAINMSLSLSSITMQSGTVGLTQLTVNSQNNFTGSVSFACSGLPSGYSCTFNPNPITVPQGGSATTSLSISSSATASAVRHDSRPLFPMTTLAVAICFLGFKKRSRLMLLVLVAVALAGFGLLSGCGGSSSSSTTKATTTTATVTATAGAVKQSTTLTIIVE